MKEGEQMAKKQAKGEVLSTRVFTEFKDEATQAAAKVANRTLGAFLEEAVREKIDREKQVRFDGSDYVPDRDNDRLQGQMDRLKAVMKDGHFRTLQQIHELTGDPEASISAQLRHLRKIRFGNYAVNKHHVSGGLFEYQVVGIA
jgi:hypothetical protein